jgi:hypothetical protein
MEMVFPHAGDLQMDFQVRAVYPLLETSISKIDG